MSFYTEIENHSSKKHILVKMAYAKIIKMALESGTLYEAIIDKEPVQVFLNGQQASPDSYPPASNAYNYNSSTKKLTVNSLIFPAVHTVNNLFFSDGKNRSAPIIPTDPNSQIIEWEARLLNDISFSQSVDAINLGVVNITTDSIQLENSDGSLDHLFRRDYSIRNRPIEVFISCNGETVKLGESYGVELSKGFSSVTVKTKDGAELLNQQNTMGDRVQEYSIYNGNFLYPNQDPAKFGAIIPYLIGKNSGSTPNLFGSIATKKALIKTESMLEAVCFSYSATMATNLNRTWGCHRSKNDETATIVVNVTTIPSIVFEMPTEEIAAGFSYGDIISSFSSSFLVYSVSGKFVDVSLIQGSAPSSPLTVYVGNISNVVVVDGDSEYTCIPARDYTLSVNPTSNGNYFTRIVFSNNFEAIVGMTGPLDPSKHNVLYKARGASEPHKDAAKLIIEKNLLRFSEDYLSDSETVSFVIGRDLNQESIIDSIQKITSSNTSILCQNLEGKFVYRTPNYPLDVSIDDIKKQEMILGSYSEQENAQDTCSTLKIVRESNFLNFAQTSDNAISAFNGANISKEILIVSDEISDTVLEKIISKSFYKSKTVDLGVKARLYSLIVGDSLKVMGKNLLVTGIKKGVSGVFVTCSNILDGGDL